MRRQKTLPQLLSFEATDGVKLPALLYRPGRTKKALLFLHGCGTSSVFYKGDFMNLAATMLSKEGIAFFPFDNRGALAVHRLKRRVRNGDDERVPSGSAFELIGECEFDIDGALRFLRSEGFTEFHIVGHSTGANKIVLYDKLKRGRTAFQSYLLYGGGDDAGIYRQKLGSKLDHFLTVARRMVRKGKGLQLVPQRWLPYPYSYQSFYDIALPGGDYDIFPFYAAIRRRNRRHFQALRRIRKRTLLVYGDKDLANLIPIEQCVGELERALSSRKNFTFKMISGGDHSCTGVERALIDSWIKFLRK